MHSTTDRRLELTVNLTAIDIFRANMDLTWQRLAVAFVILGLAVGTLVFLDRNGPSGQLTPLTVSVTVVVLLFYPAIVGISYQRSRRTFRDSRVYKTALNYVFTEKGVAVKGPTFNAESAWSNVAQVKETKSLFVLFPQTTSAMTILPKRCFPAVSEVEAFRDLLRIHVSGKVKLLSSNSGSSR